jgi:hypothetical protein
MSQMNILVMIALMLLLPFFEKHSPGIKLLSRANLIIHFEKNSFVFPIENFPQEGILPIICGGNYCQLSSLVAKCAQSPSM